MKLEINEILHLRSNSFLKKISIGSIKYFLHSDLNLNSSINTIFQLKKELKNKRC